MLNFATFMLKNKFKLTFSKLDNKWLIATLFFLIIYCLISFVNHYCFRTYAWDLGIFNNAIYDYSRFRWNDGCVFREIPENLLSDHFDLYLILFSPLSPIFGEYTLLIVQISAIVIGSKGIYKYIQLISENKQLALLASIHFYLFFGIYSALSFDYHSNVVAALISPWFFVYLKEKKLTKAILMFILIGIAKETMPLWLFCICLGAAIEFRKEKKTRNSLIILSIIGLVWFASLVKVIMPAISIHNGYHHFNYQILGNSFEEAFVNIIKHPIKTIEYLFTNHSGKPYNDGIKSEFWWFISLSGLLFLIARPWFFIMLISPIFVKMFNSNPTIWSIDAHYSIEFAAILSIGAFTVISQIKNNRLKYLAAFLVLSGSIYSTFKYFDGTVYWHPYERIRFYQESHYNNNYSISVAHEMIGMVPKNAIVSAQSPFVPHFAYRDKAYQFPVIRDAEYIMVCSKEYFYPIDEKEFNLKIEELKSSGEWTLIKEHEGLMLFKKK